MILWLKMLHLPRYLLFVQVIGQSLISKATNACIDAAKLATTSSLRLDLLQPWFLSKRFTLITRSAAPLASSNVALLPSLSARRAQRLYLGAREKLMAFLSRQMPLENSWAWESLPRVLSTPAQPSQTVKFRPTKQRPQWPTLSVPLEALQLNKTTLTSSKDRNKLRPSKRFNSRSRTTAAGRSGLTQLSTKPESKSMVHVIRTTVDLRAATAIL